MRLLILLLIPTAALLAQTPDPKTLVGGQAALQDIVRNNIVKSAEKMPEEHYAFKPTPEVRSFGQLIGHIADAQYFFCSTALGEKNPAPRIEKTKSGKADLSAALKEAFAYCDKAYAMADDQATQMVKFLGAERTKLAVLSFNSMHNMEHYGNIVTYMRMKGLVPPSSEGRR
jgi:uncharacterized damage-inducible protein DinB